MIPRFGGGAAVGVGGAVEREGKGVVCSGAWRSGGGGGDAAALEGSGREDVEDDGGDCCTWVGTGDCGIPGLESAESRIGGTTGDWDPEEGLCPLARPGELYPLPRESVMSKKLPIHITDNINKLPSVKT